jgi:hypothetical protein
MEDQANMNSSMPSGKSGSAGPVIGAIVILAVIILGGLYFWGQRSGDDTDRAVDEANMQSDSDEAAAIEADLESTDLEDVDVEMNAS